MLVCERYFRIGRWRGIVENYTLRDDREADDTTRCDDGEADDRKADDTL
jgi:hypothetical protein